MMLMHNIMENNINYAKHRKFIAASKNNLSDNITDSESLIPAAFNIKEVEIVVPLKYLTLKVTL